MKLRPYQQTLVDQARAAFAAGANRVLIQLPTGGGKTVILSEVARAAASRNSKTLTMAHRKEIVRQIADRMTTFGLCPSIVDTGTRSSSKVTANTIVAMQQTLVRRIENVDRPDLLITDEAHHQLAAGYQKITDAWPDTKLLGLTATPARLDGKPLKDCFDVMICGPTVKELIAMGSLSDFVYLAPPIDPAVMLQMKNMKIRGGDYRRDEMEAVCNRKPIIGDCVNHYRDLFNGKPVIVFCISVAHGEAVALEFSRAGFRSSAVSGSMRTDERDEIIENFRNGQISVLVSCDLIGEGFDVPDCAGVILMRPTASLTIFLQQVGRALRPKADGSKAIILDHVGNCYKHGRPDDDREWSLEGKLPKNQVSIQQCPKCFMVIDPTSAAIIGECPSQRYAWPECHYNVVADETGEREKNIEYLDGELVEYVPPVTLDWAGEIDVKSAAGMDYTRLLRSAGTDKERLKQIAEIRGYTPGWVHVRLTKIEAGKRKYGGSAF